MAMLMALKCREKRPASKPSTVSISHMRNSLKLLIGLTMPGLALAAVLWLWTTRQESKNDDDDRAAQNSGIIGSRVNTQEKSKCFSLESEIASGRSSDFRDVEQKECVNAEDGAAELSNFSSGERYCIKHTHCSKQGSSESRNESMNMGSTGVTSNVSDMSELSGTVLTREELLENSARAEEEKQLEFYHKSDSKSAEFTRNNETGSSIGAHSSEMNPVASSKVDDFHNKNIESSLNTTASKFDHSRSKNVDNVSDSDPSHSKDAASLEIVSVSQKSDDNTRGTASRTQSLDEYSDVSSAEGQAESPLDEKRTSNAGSDIENAPPEGDFDEEFTWELEFPQALCGRLIGKKGKNVQKISQVTGTKIRLIPQKENTESSQRLVSLTGSRKQLELALRKLREKFPSVPFTRLNDSVPYAEKNEESRTPSIVCVALPENELCQVFVTNIVAANHFYVQLHDHSIHSHLRQLNQRMYECYSSTSTTMIPQAINTGMLCASLSTSGWWWRAQVVGLLMNPDEVEIMWLDYGGRMTVATTMLRQLRSDFLQLPFQAVECYLSNVVPHHGESSFSMAACALFEELTQNVVLTARITSYTKDCPNLELYVTDQWTGQPIFVNREFVRRGFARWSEI